MSCPAACRALWAASDQGIIIIETESFEAIEDE